MKYVSHALLVLLGLALAACGNSEPVVPTTSAPAPTPDLASNTLPIENAEPAVRALARSVVRIELPEGSNGSGFFISPRILVTNYHVVPRERCSEEVCPGVTAIRGFYEGGENQVFYRLKPLGFDQALDYIFLETLDAAAPVEGLALASEQELPSLLQQPLVALGHPLAAPLKASPASLVGRTPDKLHVDTAIFDGSSGGPLVHIASGKVVGLVSEIQLDSTQYQIGTKEVPFHAVAQEIPSVVASLRQEHPGTRNELKWDPYQFKTQSLPVSLALFLFGPKKTAEWFFSTKQKDAESVSDQAARVMSELLHVSDGGNSFQQFLLQLVNYDLARGAPSPISPHLIAQVEKLEGMGKVKERFLNFYNPDLRQACSQANAPDLRMMGHLCHTTEYENKDILALGAGLVDSLKIDSEGYANAMFIIIEDQLRLRTALTWHDQKSINALIPSIDSKIETGGLRAQWDAFKLLWKSNPGLLLNGGVAASF